MGCGYAVPIYKSIIEKGLAQGHERGLKEGHERGLKQGLKKDGLTELRQAIVDIVQERLPALVPFVESQVATINDPAQLRHLIVKLITISNAEQAIQVFLDVQQEQ